METQTHWNGSDAMQQIAPCFGVVDWQGVRLLPVAADWPVVTHQIAGSKAQTSDIAIRTSRANQPSPWE